MKRQARRPRSGSVGSAPVFGAGLLAGIVITWMVSLFVGNNSCSDDSLSIDRASGWDDTPLVSDSDALTYGPYRFFDELPAVESARPDPVVRPVPDIDDSAAAVVYFIQVAALDSAEAAEGLRAQLTLSGFQALATKGAVAGQRVHRVRVGPFDRMEDASQAQASLFSAGFDSFILAQRLVNHE